jgi:amidase
VTDDLLHSGVQGQAEAVATGAVTAADLTDAVLARIAAVDPQLNAFTVVLADEARAEAAARDVALADGGPAGPLHGVPVAIKEENAVAGVVTTFGGRANHRPAAEDGLVARRLREAGAVVVGKTNMPEFGQFPFTESVHHGDTHNPWDLGRTPGGSSGGTAAAVASGMVAVGIGGDGGGSIRIPSACCGLFGLKPTRGRVSTAPAADLWCGLGTVGPLTRTVLDSATVYDVIRGNGPGDRFTLADPEVPFAESARLAPAASQRTLRVAWSTTSPARGMRPDPEHVRAVEETATLLEGLGHEVVEIDPRYPETIGAFLPQMFRGVREEADRMDEPGLLEARTKQALLIGRWATPRVAAWAAREGEKLRRKVDERVFAQADVLLTPTITKRPNPIGVLGRAPQPVALLKSMPMVAYTAIWNVTGHPAAAVPSGFGPDGLPTSVQLVGRFGDESTLFALSAQIESVRPWADRWPPL